MTNTNIISRPAAALTSIAAMVQLVEIEIPFTGFYNTMIGAELDDAVTHEIESINEEEGLSLTSDDFDISYSDMFEAAAESIAEYYPEWLEDLTGVEISCEFKGLESPREYNFYNDAIICDIPRHDIYNLLSWLEDNHPGFFAEYVKERMTPRDGWAPFYPAELSSWGHPDSWKPAQLSLVLAAVNAAALGEYPEYYDTLEGSWADRCLSNFWGANSFMTRLYDPSIGLPDECDIRFVLSFYLPYLVNGDTDNLTVGDIEVLQKFEEEYEFIGVIQKSVDNTEYRQCDISGAYGDCEPVAVKHRESEEV